MLSDVTTATPMLRVIYLQKRGDENLCSTLWRKCLLAIASLDGNAGKEELIAFLDASERGLLPMYLKPMDDELDQYASQLIADAVSSGTTESLTIANRVLCKPGANLNTSRLRCI